MTLNSEFLPVNADEMRARGWYYCDFIYVSGDAYVDHPSFGTSIISRVLEAEGFRVGIVAQPKTDGGVLQTDFPAPRLGVLVSAGNLDSMVAHYTVAKHSRGEDYYSPGGRTGLRPDRAVEVYTRAAKAKYPSSPVIIGGLEASLRRFAHYDYWSDTVMPSILISSGADLLSYGMGEHSIVEIAHLLKKGIAASEITHVRGTCFVSDTAGRSGFTEAECAPYGKLSDKREYAKACRMQFREQDFTSETAILQRHGAKFLVQNPPALPLTTEEMDRVYALPYTRTYHPMYERFGGVPGLAEVRFSITHVRGCFGNCSFCSLAFHQGRYISARSHESVLAEARLLTELPDFKGYINDVGGPTANFRAPACDKQKEHGLCRDRSCLTPKPCPNLKVSHEDYLQLLREIKALPGVKKVFIRSGVRYDYVMLDKSDEFLREIVRDHVSGQLKVAPEHCAPEVLMCMNKPSFEVFKAFKAKFEAITAEIGKKQYLVPYLMSSHPGSTMQDAEALASYLRAEHMNPEQVQDFYPTPGTIATCMFYTGLDPRTMKPVYVPRTAEEKAAQRALLQERIPKNARLIREYEQKNGRHENRR